MLQGTIFHSQQLAGFHTINFCADQSKICGNSLSCSNDKSERPMHRLQQKKVLHFWSQERGKFFRKEEDLAFRMQDVILQQQKQPKQQQQQQQQLRPIPATLAPAFHHQQQQQQHQLEEQQQHFLPQPPLQHLPPVKKEAIPFRFPDEDPYVNHAANRPVFNRQPEPEFIYNDDEQQQQQVLQGQAKRKIVSQPAVENSSDEGDQVPVLVTPLPVNEDRRKKVPRVIEANKARNPLEK